MEQRLRSALFDRLELVSEEASCAEPSSLVRLARTEIRRMTDGWRELLTSHQPDDDGRCPQCSGWFRRRRWPCPVWLSAHHHLIGDSLWHKPRPKPSPSPFGKRNPTIVKPRQLPARPDAVSRTVSRTVSQPVTPRALMAGSAGATPVHRAAVVERAPRPRLQAVGRAG